MTPYSEEIEQLMQTYYRTLSEKDRRRYAATKRPPAESRWVWKPLKVAVQAEAC